MDMVHDIQFENMIHYVVNFIGPEEDVVYCRRELASCSKDGSFTMFDMDKLMPLPEGMKKGSVEASIWEQSVRGSSGLFNVREDGLKHVMFDNGDMLLSYKVFDAIVEKYPTIKLAVVEGMDGEHGMGSTITRYENDGTGPVHDIILTTKEMHPEPLEKGNYSIEKASWLQYMAERSMYGIVLTNEECRAASLENGAMMYPDGNLFGIPVAKARFSSKEEAMGFIHHLENSCFEQSGSQKGLYELGSFIKKYSKRLETLPKEGCERFVEELYKHESSFLGRFNDEYKKYKESCSMKTEIVFEFNRGRSNERSCN